MGWFDNVIKNPISTIVNPIGTIADGMIPGAGNVVGNVPSIVTKPIDQKVGGGGAQAGGSGVPQYTPEQMRQMRETDIQEGQNRYRQTVTNDPEMKSITQRYKEMSQGYSAPQAQALKDQMIQGQQSNNQAQLRQLLARQGQQGVGGARAVAQQSQLMRDQSGARANAERDLLIKNYDAQRQGLNDYSNMYGQQKYGEIASGLGEAGLGVSDRTGSMQAAIGQAMANASKSGGKK